MPFATSLTVDVLIKIVFTAERVLTACKNLEIAQLLFHAWIALLYFYFVALEHIWLARWGRVYNNLQRQDRAARIGLLREVPKREQLRVVFIVLVGVSIFWFFY